MNTRRVGTNGERLRLGEASARSLLAGHGHLLRGSAWLVTSVAANAVGGFAFWLAAARVDSTDDVGRAAALFTWILFVNYATNMGLAVAIARYAPDEGESSHAVFGWALTYTALASIVGALVFLAFAPDSASDTLSGWAGPFGYVLFAVVAVGMSFAVLVEVRLMSLRRWGWVFTRVALVGLVRLPLVFVDPGIDDARWLFILVAGTPALSGVIGAVALGWHRALFRPLPESWRVAVRYAWINYVGVLAVQAPTFAVPVIVAEQVSSSQYAAFYVAFSITTVLFLVPHTLGQVLLVEGGKGAARLAHQVRLGLGLALGLMAVVAVAMYLGSGIVTLIYGQDYESAAEILPTMVAAGVAWAVTSIFLTKARVEANASAIVTIAVALAVSIVGPALVFTARDGIQGAARAWLLGNLVAATVAVLVSVRARFGRGTLASDAAWLTAAGDTPRAPDALSTH